LLRKHGEFVNGTEMELLSIEVEWWDTLQPDPTGRGVIVLSIEWHGCSLICMYSTRMCACIVRWWRWKNQYDLYLTDDSLYVNDRLIQFVELLIKKCWSENVWVIKF
jgi:hypothetical protein